MSDFRGRGIYIESLRAHPGQEVVNIFLNNFPPLPRHTAGNGALCSNGLRT